MRTLHLQTLIVLWGALALLPTPAVLQAQATPDSLASSPAVDVGDRVRVTTGLETALTVGWIDALPSGSIRLVRAEDHEVLTFPAQSIERIEISTSRRSSSKRAMPGMIAGGLLGALGGYLVADANVEDCSGTFCFDDLERATGVWLGASAGILIGGGIAVAVTPAETWAQARLPRNPDRERTSLMQPRGLGLALSVRIGGIP